MAGMQAFQRRPRYQQSQPEDMVIGLARLLSLQNDQMKDVTNGIDQFGQARARGEAANLLQSDEYQNELSPEKAQALLMGATNGRDTGKAGAEMLKSALGLKSNVQDNIWQNEQIDKRNANAIGLAKLRNSLTLGRMAKQNEYNIAREKIRNDEVDTLTGMTNENSGKARSKYLETIMKTKDSMLRNELIVEALKNNVLSKDDRITLDKAGYMETPSRGRSRSTTPKWGGKRYNQAHPDVRDFINSKYGREVQETEDGYFFRGQKLTPAYLKVLRGV